MNIGMYEHVVTLDVPNGSSGYLPLNPSTWYCAVRSEGTGTTTFIGPFHPGLTTPNARVHFEGRIFHIDSAVAVDERKFEVELTCREVFDGDQS
jgi:hypothetical protein